MKDLENFNLATADKHMLKYFAKEKLELSLSLSMTETTMRERIQKHCAENDIDGPTSKVEAKGGNSANIKYVTINVAKSDKKGGAEPAFVGVQGVGYTIPRGVDVSVPSSVVEVLKNAMQDIVTQDPDTGEMHSEQVLTYPFQMVSGGN
jgi:hypothetical protein